MILELLPSCHLGKFSFNCFFKLFDPLISTDFPCDPEKKNSVKYSYKCAWLTFLICITINLAWNYLLSFSSWSFGPKAFYFRRLHWKKNSIFLLFLLDNTKYLHYPLNLDERISSPSVQSFHRFYNTSHCLHI